MPRTPPCRPRLREVPSLDEFIREAYAAGSVPGADGSSRELAPHSIGLADGEALRDLAIAEGASRTIEVGLALGMSALFLCQALLAAGGDPDEHARGARHVAVDPFQRRSWDGAGLATLRAAGVADMVEVIEEESALALPELARAGRRFDFAFVDGDHRFESVLGDLVFMDRLVEPGGLIVVDDMWMPGVRLAVAYVERNLDHSLEPDALPAGFSWRRRPRLRGAVPEGSGDMAVLRVPKNPPPRPWNRFEPFF
jgi:predicted O-methyltransferase YrrM